jgi:hypothetical protein
MTLRITSSPETVSTVLVLASLWSFATSLSAASPSVDTRSVLTPWVSGDMLAERGRTGSLYISLARDVGGPFPGVEGYWSREWKDGHRTVEVKDGSVVERWLGYRIPDERVKGDFDVEIEYTCRENQCEVRTYLTSRLNIGVCDLRHVFRMSPVVSAQPDKTFVLFGMDEWVQDPVTRLAADRVNRKLATAPTAFLDEGENHGLYRNRCSPRPMISIHTRQFGLVVYDLDPDNAASGSLLVGSNDGALEFGWAYRAPAEHKPGNGRRDTRIPIGPAIRFVHLPGRPDVENAWWDALRVYREYAIQSGLLASPLLKDRNVPATWARDNLSFVVNVGTPVGGDPKHKITADSAIEIIRGMVRFYRATGQRRFTPMFWGWSAVGPYQAPDGFDDLLARVREMERQLDVEIHPAVYMHACMFSEATVGTELEECLMRDLRGKPFTWGGGLYNAHADHPAFLGEIERNVRDMVRRGVRGFYFDCPFAEEMPDYSRDGVVREHHVAVRRMMLRVERLLSESGGGVISHEAQRIGLPGYKGAAAPTVPGSRIIPFTEALYHEREVPIFFGDLAGLPYSIAAADARLLGSGNYESDDDIVRLAIEGAVYGRSAVMCNGLDRPYYEMRDSDKWADQAMYRMAGEAMPNALRARREHRELQTGRMLPCPKHEVVEHTVLLRPWVYLTAAAGTGVELQKELTELRTVRTPAAFYEDTEAQGRYLLVSGNTGRTAVLQHFTLVVSDLPGFPGPMDKVRIEGATVQSRTNDAIELVVEVPENNLACVEILVEG